ncbi:hypothetical protein F5148DRAFT_424059 [Russula earlei]|uniref:Uncharacterized protein n=1 Tax=Russula earlei TaxID=71964 RepID=A0ACC0TZ70_9AGAM|nr:hypothetical protein F5148DRAFT_424059 [Russula earlei]
MASLSIPPPAGPSPTRLDWRQAGERTSTLRTTNKIRGGANPSDRGRGGRGGRRGGASSRGVKGHTSAPTEKGVNAPTATPVPFKSNLSIVSPPSHAATTSKNASSTSTSLAQTPPSVEPPEKPKAGPRRPSQRAADKLPSLTIQPASPTVTSFGSTPHSASTTSSRPSARRRRRSHNKPSAATISSENLTVETLASAMKAQRSSSGPSSPHPKEESPPKTAPPNLSTAPTLAGASAKSNIDSLVEHVRALAMDHRPSTPGSHIDWAGDEDDSLPDLDDWGVPPSSVPPADLKPGATASVEKAQLQLMSPILDDSLKQLPHSFDKTTPSPSVGSGSLSPNIANGAPAVPAHGLDNGHGAGVAEAPSSLVGAGGNPEDRSPGLSAPSSQPHPSSPPAVSQPLGASLPSEPTPASEVGPSKDTPPHISGSTSQLPPPPSSVTPPIQSGRGLADSMHAPSHATHAPCEARGTEADDEAGKEGLTASTNVPTAAPDSGELSEGPRSAPCNAPTHGRSQTLGRPPPFSAGGRRGFFSGSSTPAGAGATKGPHHGRTQSSPVTHRRQHSRPVITVDAMTRLAKTLGTVPPKREVAATNSATSSE